MFIVIEGLDGAGHRTQIKLLANYFRKKGKKVITIKTPDKSKPVGRSYYAYLDKKFELNKEAVFFLCAADVISNKETIEKKDVIILSDRYITSTIAYQGANGLDVKKSIEIINIMGFPKADAIIYIDILPEVGIERKTKIKKLDRHESDKKFQEKAKKIYMYQIKNNILGEWFVVDGNKSIKEVYEQIVKLLQSKFNL